MSKRFQLTETEIKNRASSKVYSRGQGYYESDMISATIQRGDEIEAACEGSYVTPYRVWAKLGEEGVIATRCSCEYDWGGDCKHRVAMLLTYAYEPELFVERRPLNEILADLSKEHLVDLMQQMILRYPDLQDIVDRPMPADGAEAVSNLNLQSIRNELNKALTPPEGWGDHRAEEKVRELCDLGDRFGSKQYYQQAILIYCTIIEACNASDYLNFDEEGYYASAVGDTVEQLQATLESYDLQHDDTLRQRVIDVMLETFICDVDFGGIDYGYPADDILLAVAQPADVPAIRARIEKEKAAKSQNTYSNWSVGVYESLLMDLDIINPVDPEETLKRLAAQDLHTLRVTKLLQLDRVDEALTVIHEHIDREHDFIKVLHLLHEHGEQQKAIQLAEEWLVQKPHSFIADMLIGLYLDVGDKAAALKWQLKQTTVNPTIQNYAALKVTAQDVQQWETIRPQLLEELTNKSALDALIHIHLHEENWEQAWETLDALNVENVNTSRWHVYRTDYTVAEQTSHIFPERAIPVYMKYVREHIDRRNRSDYATAAKLLKNVKHLYRKVGDEETFNQKLTDLRAELKRLPAFQDELNKAGLK